MALPPPLPIAGQKRGPGRPPKTAASPVTKKQKRGDTNAGDSENLGSPFQEPTVPEEDTLPSRLHKHDRLPTLSQPQPINLSEEDYASIASSGVLSASLEKSKQSWTADGVFERYWVKPETGKHAKPPPVGNPDLKSMKGRGRCRLRIEPHIFEVEVWVVEKPKLPAVKQNQQAWQHQPFHNVKPANQSQQTSASKTDQKTTSDPVIGMLATRAGSDPELKALMREVAAGKASQDQLKIFQKHIDELSALIQAQKTKEEEEKRKMAPPAVHAAQPVYAAPTQPAPAEVVFSFTAVGASPDRFLFPRHCILETLTPQHLLASFLITRPAKTEDEGSAENETIWIPVTLMIEVAYGREGILKDIRQWVKPAEQSREYMKEIISKHKRASERHLALRLPFKSARGSQSVSHASTPVPVPIEEKKKKPRKSVGSSLKQTDVVSNHAESAGIVKSEQQTSSKNATSAQQTTDEIKVEPGVDIADGETNVAGARRSSRATRRSLRASDQ